MPYCSLCSTGRYFTEVGLQNHRESKHPSKFGCQYCNREFTTDQGRLSHQEAKHSLVFECNYCDREFKTAQGRESHEAAKHPSTFECRHCDREFSSEDAREQHEAAKHPDTFECRYCDREFNSEDAREQHEAAKHPDTFECRYCGREFNSEGAREQHEDAKHPYRCLICGRNDFTSESASRQHREDKHYECHHCYELFSSETARLAHERAVHLQSGSGGSPPGRFTNSGGCRIQPGQITQYFNCIYCSEKFTTQDSKIDHEVVCLANPATRAELGRTSLLPGLSSPPSKDNDLMSEDEASDSTQSFEEPTPCPSSDSADGELYRSSSGICTYSAGTNGESAAIERAFTCSHSLEPGTCSTCQQPPSNAKIPAPVDAGNAVSADDIRMDSSDPYICTPCLQSFETREALQSHACPALTTMLRPHCSTCYTSFDDWALVREHIDKGTLLCKHCQTRCCSDEMMQDHLLGHPTCSKCGESFANDLALCTHIETDHPAVICWDCDGAVVENLESHYLDSPEHPSCAFCGIGKRISAEMDEHVRDVHAVSADDQLDDEVYVDVKEVPVAEGYTPGEIQEETMVGPLDSAERTRSPFAMEIRDTLHDPETRDLMQGSTLQTDLPLFSSLPVNQADDEQIMSPHTMDEEDGRDVDLRQLVPPSPTPSEHGSDESRSQSMVTNANNEGPPSPATSSAEPFSDSTRSSPSPTSSSQSVVFVSADRIPDYIRENRAILVATSSRSSSGQDAFPSSESSLAASLDVPATPGYVNDVTHRLHCRVCLRDPCEDMTATMCGHVFCKRCITRAVVETSECPVCKSATLLYCLFQLHLSD